jgi:hypothetical protein
MSTTVPMPVRVKPPPAEMGEIISPGCASLVVTTPSNGARMTMSSICCCHKATWRSPVVMSSSCCRQARRSDLALDSAVQVGLRRDVLFGQLGFAREFLVGLFELRPGFFQRRRAESNWAWATSRLVRMLESSSRATTWLFLDLHALLDSTSMTLPVTLDETVACRRAVT